MRTRTKICIFMILAPPVTVVTLCTVLGRHLNKDYAYRPAEDECEFGVVSARLLGTFMEQEEGTVRASPYELLIAFDSRDGGGSVSLKTLELRDAAKQDCVYATVAQETQPLNRTSTGGYSAYFSVEGLDLAYVRYILSIRIEVRKGGQTETRDIDVTLEQDYREYRSNVFWDGFMSV